MQATGQIHKVIITGTGRAGTTFLVRLLTELGLDTGYGSESWREAHFAHCNAGLEQEHDPADPRSPYIIKNPALCVELPRLLATHRIVIDHALIPIRDLEDAARSRIRIGGDGTVPGGLWRTTDPAQQKAVLAEVFHELVHTLHVHDIPHTFLLFPRMVQDAGYVYEKLGPVLGEITKEKFNAVFARLANPALVHVFSDPQRPAAPEPGLAASFFDERRRQRSRRHARRFVRAVSVAAVLAVMVGAYWRAPFGPFGHGAKTLMAPGTIVAAAPGPAPAHYDFEFNRGIVGGFPGSSSSGSFAGGGFISQAQSSPAIYRPVSGPASTTANRDFSPAASLPANNSPRREP